jgi:hypothetical protein
MAAVNLATTSLSALVPWLDGVGFDTRTFIVNLLSFAATLAGRA